MPDSPADLHAEIARLQHELQEAQALAADATEYRVLLPDAGGETLIVRRQSLLHGEGWAVSTMGRGGGLALTLEGWQDAIGALTVDRLFCWPDPTTAIRKARTALTSPLS
ncbi:hypothetical protein FNV58_00880 (plasmid) [Streptomyces sp. RLB1-9]|uniref:hypothetical protein n=1 Tax=Streptomyces sp. RLB1-9 TaxID=2594454 RepID=UPI0011647C39|nr:hypothetical protein [Streptomyces sp. RLB1-9]QDN94914.1 hypothetical protein FNV58_00880 [Streptomyces sp. RLB1-9]